MRSLGSPSVQRAFARQGQLDALHLGAPALLQPSDDEVARVICEDVHEAFVANARREAQGSRAKVGAIVHVTQVPVLGLEENAQHYCVHARFHAQQILHHLRVHMCT